MTPYRSSGLETAYSPDETMARGVVTRELKAGEELIWAQRPKRGVYVQKADLKQIAFGVVWVLMLGMWMTRLLAAGSLLGLVLLPFVLLGVVLGLGRPLLQAFDTTISFYAITDQRVLIVRARGQRRTVEDYPLAHIDPQFLAIGYRAKGYADLWLKERFVDGSEGGRHERAPTLVAVPEGDRVYDQIVAARAAHLARAGRIP